MVAWVDSQPDKLAISGFPDNISEISDAVYTLPQILPSVFTNKPFGERISQKLCHHIIGLGRVNHVARTKTR
jgi:hypothetical protein